MLILRHYRRYCAATLSVEIGPISTGPRGDHPPALAIPGQAPGVFSLASRGRHRRGREWPGGLQGDLPGPVVERRPEVLQGPRMAQHNPQTIEKTDPRRPAIGRPPAAEFEVNRR